VKPRTIVALLVLALLIFGAAWAAAQGVNLFAQPGAKPVTSNAPAPAAEPTSEPSANVPSGIPVGAWQATVTYVHDGDTLYLDREKVRLIGVDTPEVGEHAECFGEDARELLRDILPEGETVWALEDRDAYDRYDRALLYVFTDDGIFVNLELVELGAAVAIKVGANDAYWPELRAAERAAQDAGLGMWGACGR
jgi:micrococcal nuclease